MPPLSYKQSGVDIATADAAKKKMAAMLKSSDKRVLNSVGAFASLLDGRFPGYKHPILVMKTEEPGTKQKLAFEHGFVESICQDMIHHLINDIIVMGATPLFVQDAVICGKLEKEVVTKIVSSIAAACRAQGCALTGGETSEQPGVLAPGTYVLTSSIVGVAEKKNIIDGSKIKKGDVVIAVPSNGLHTNGYSLARALMAKDPSLARRKIGKRTFLETIMLPHTCYYQVMRDLYVGEGVHGMAHITGGGIAGNLNRILPKTLDASVDLGTIRVLPIFSCIKQEGGVDDADMLRTYNMGVGLTLVADPKKVSSVLSHLHNKGHDAYVVGEIVKGKGNVRYSGKIPW